MISRCIHVYEKKGSSQTIFPQTDQRLGSKKKGEKEVFSFFELFHLVYFEGIWCELIMLHFG